MTPNEEIWFRVYSLEFARLWAEYQVTVLGPLGVPSDPPTTAELDLGRRAALVADLAVLAEPDATQAALTARIAALKV